MCGRYTDPSSVDEAIEEFSVTRTVPDLRGYRPRFNVAPTMDGFAVVEEDGTRTLDRFFWTFIPPWSKDGKPGAFSTTNARSDKVAESKLYAPSFKSRRCIVAAGGFYEWRGREQPKQPYHICRADRRPLAFAGVWSAWKSPVDGTTRRSFAIVTTDANGVMQPIHSRMPAILGPDDYAPWLDSNNRDLAVLAELLRPCPDDWLEAWPVSTRVNKSGTEGPDLIAPATLE